MCPPPCNCQRGESTTLAQMRQRAAQIAALAPRYLPFLRRRPDPVRQLIVSRTEEHLRLLHRTTQQMLPPVSDSLPLLTPIDIRAIVLERSNNRGPRAH